MTVLENEMTIKMLEKREQEVKKSLKSDKEKELFLLALQKRINKYKKSIDRN